MKARVLAFFGVLADTSQLCWRVPLSRFRDIGDPVDEIRKRRNIRWGIITRRLFSPPVHVSRLTLFQQTGSVDPPLTHDEALALLASTPSELLFKKLYLSRGDMDAQDTLGIILHSPLPTLFTILENAGVNLNAKYPSGRTLMHIAAGELHWRERYPNMPTIVKQLVELGVTPLPDANGNDPLQIHFEKMSSIREETVELLLVAGCNPNTSISAGDKNRFDTYFPHGNRNYRATLLHEAAAQVNEKAFVALLKHGADPLGLDSRGLPVSELIQFRLSFEKNEVKEKL